MSKPREISGWHQLPMRFRLVRFTRRHWDGSATPWHRRGWRVRRYAS